MERPPPMDERINILEFAKTFNCRCPYGKQNSDKQVLPYPSTSNGHTILDWLGVLPSNKFHTHSN